jgi:hypothetical protein
MVNVIVVEKRGFVEQAQSSKMWSLSTAALLVERTESRVGRPPSVPLISPADG